jgi:hypothetical protein
VKRAFLVALLAACGQPPVVDGGVPYDAGQQPDGGAPVDAGEVDAGEPFDAGPPDPWADRIVSFTPGAGAGFGQNRLPDVVLGPPQGEGDSAGSLDVLSLGRDGVIVLELADFELVDGPGVDLLVFENTFAGFVETGVVAVSYDGGSWFEWPCAALTDGGTEGCAGVHPVYSAPGNGISATDPLVAGGDGFDLSQLGVTRARFVRVRDSGKNMFGPPGGGFDLDAISIVNGEAPP